MEEWPLQRYQPSIPLYGEAIDLGCMLLESVLIGVNYRYSTCMPVVCADPWYEAKHTTGLAQYRQHAKGCMRKAFPITVLLRARSFALIIHNLRVVRVRHSQTRMLI